MMEERVISRAILFGVTLAMLQPALASGPVRMTVVGCVSHGVFRSDDGYLIKLRQHGGGLLNLTPWNGKRLRVTGNLLPSDNLFVLSAPTIVGACR
jgi:hypothetical protein